MRPGLLLTSLTSLFALLAAPRAAGASPACTGPWGIASAPAGCPLVVFERDPGTGAPPIEVRRNGELVADAVVETTSLLLDVDHVDVTCGTGAVVYTEAEPFLRRQITISGAQAGDEISIGGFGAGTLVAPGPCVEPVVTPTCYADPSRIPCDELVGDDADGGCRASQRSGGAVALAVGALLLGRRRRPARPR